MPAMLHTAGIIIAAGTDLWALGSLKKFLRRALCTRAVKGLQSSFLPADEHSLLFPMEKNLSLEWPWESKTDSRICWLRLPGQHSSHWSLMGDAQRKVSHADEAAKHIQNKNLPAFLFDWTQQVPELKWDTCGHQQLQSLELVKAKLLEGCFVPSWKHHFLLLLLLSNLHLSVQLLNEMFSHWPLHIKIAPPSNAGPCPGTQCSHIGTPHHQGSCLLKSEQWQEWARCSPSLFIKHSSNTSAVFRESIQP